MRDPGVVIVGGGLAAQRAVETLRWRGYTAPVRIVRGLSGGGDLRGRRRERGDRLPEIFTSVH
ncbi:MAG: hypothetical protein JJE35_02050 [Thermoleophilia bacterium]|nr:hypothetical protein [Thermoleophilia bacterium]